MRTWLLFAGILLPSLASAADRPNILYIMSDDHAAHAISAYGSRLAAIAPTPNIDRLAADGLTFTRAYCQQAVCSPSRTSLMTGRRPDTTRVYDRQFS